MILHFWHHFRDGQTFGLKFTEAVRYGWHYRNIRRNLPKVAS